MTKHQYDARMAAARVAAKQAECDNLRAMLSKMSELSHMMHHRLNVVTAEVGAEIKAHDYAQKRKKEKTTKRKPL